jgi:hypothetical protein
LGPVLRGEAHARSEEQEAQQQGQLSEDGSIRAVHASGCLQWTRRPPLFERLGRCTVWQAYNPLHTCEPHPSSFGIFDTFPGEEGRKAHLNGQVAAALMA